MPNKVIMFALLAFSCAENCWGQARSGGPPLPSRINVPALEVVLRAEIDLAEHPKVACLEIDGTDPSSQLIKSLQSDGLRFRKASWCRGGPRGFVFSLRYVAKESGMYEITAEAVDMSLSEVDFAVLLHRYKYVVESRGQNDPKILNREKLCCEISAGPAHI